MSGKSYSRRGASWRVAWLLAAVSGIACCIVHAADPQTYAVTFSATGERPLDTALRDSSDLNALRKSAPASPFALILRARQDVDRLRSVLDSYGYYAARVTISVEGHGLEENGLAELLEALPTDKEAAVKVDIDRGALYHLRQVIIDGELPDSARTTLALESGAPAVAADALAARARVLASLQQQGYAFARLDTPIAYVDAQAPVIDLHFPVSTGEQVTLGKIDVRGLQRTHEAMARSRIKVEPGERYDPRRLDQSRRDLLALGVFSGVSVQTPQAADDQQQLPVTFQVAERMLHAVKLAADYSSDLGVDAGATWTDRNVFGNAEQLNITANAVNLGGRATRIPGYDVQADLLEPDRQRTDQSLRYGVAAIKQSLQTYDVQSVALTAQRERRFSEWWAGTLGLQLKRSRVNQLGQDDLYTQLAVPLTARYDNTRQSNLLQDPLRGMRVTVSLTPGEILDQPRQTLLAAQGSVSTYLDLSRGNAGRTVLAMRALAGNIFGASQFSLPPDQRFYGGGSATVRGYNYQSLGPTVSGLLAGVQTTVPAGGTTVAAATGELRQRVGSNFGVALFIDTGQVTASKSPFKGTWSVGVGAGLRYYTALGPIRFDVAVPENPRPTDTRLVVYIGLGQAF
jgi:translocation and assembly module TamA